MKDGFGDGLERMARREEFAAACRGAAERRADGARAAPVGGRRGHGSRTPVVETYPGTTISVTVDGPAGGHVRAGGVVQRGGGRAARPGARRGGAAGGS